MRKKTRNHRGTLRCLGVMPPTGGSRRITTAACILILLLAVLAAGPAIRHHKEQTLPGSQDATGQASTAPIDYTTAARYADGNPIDARPHTGGYHRDSQFGQWRKKGGACPYATTRDHILQRDLTAVKVSKGCRVLSGDFQDPYTGKTMHFIKGPETSQQVQIDHIVSVHDAWASGLWKPERAGERDDYYNDPEVLQAADGPSNQDKGDGIDWHAVRDPVWMPENRSWHCDYMAKRAYIKHKYRLTMTPAEREQTISVIESCADRTKLEER